MEFSKLELLSCNVLDENKQILQDINLLSKGLYKEIGWHYFVDLSWVINQLQMHNVMPGATILDAGAGNGLLQFLLSYYGYNVISVDFSPRSFTLFAKFLYKFEAINNNKQYTNQYISHIKNVSSLKYKLKRLWYLFIKGKLNLFSFVELMNRFHKLSIKPGKIFLYQADMQEMGEIQTNSVDAIVSISAIEHMETKSISKAINELKRVLKRNQLMFITTSASNHGDWYHKPSEGWCFSFQTLSRLFTISNKQSNSVNKFDEILSEYQNNVFLRTKLASIYFVSEKNGMPNGIWNPQYVPVGIIVKKGNV